MVRGGNAKGVAGFTLFLPTAGASAKGEVRTQHLLGLHVSSGLAPNPLECKSRLDFTGLSPGHLTGVAGESHRVPVSFGSPSREGIPAKSSRPARSVSSAMHGEWSRAFGARPPLCSAVALAVAGPARGPPCSAQPVRSISMDRRSVVRSGLNGAFTSG